MKPALSVSKGISNNEVKIFVAAHPLLPLYHDLISKNPGGIAGTFVLFYHRPLL
jgi:hypothetical protein